MNSEEYINNLSARTEVYNVEAINIRLLKNLSPLHMVLGLATEAGELLEAAHHDKRNVIEECGDLLWYLAGIHRWTKLPFPDEKNDEHLFLTFEELRIAIAISSAHLLDVFKKMIYYNREIDMLAFNARCHDALRAIDMIIYLVGSNRAEAMEANIEKLRKRYPNQFTEECANQRNIEFELNHIKE